MKLLPKTIRLFEVISVTLYIVTIHDNRIRNTFSVTKWWWPDSIKLMMDWTKIIVCQVRYIRWMETDSNKIVACQHVVQMTWKLSKRYHVREDFPVQSKIRQVGTDNWAKYVTQCYRNDSDRYTVELPNHIWHHRIWRCENYGAHRRQENDWTNFKRLNSTAKQLTRLCTPSATKKNRGFDK